jgi:hypothetical protein
MERHAAVAIMAGLGGPMIARLTAIFLVLAALIAAAAPAAAAQAGPTLAGQVFSITVFADNNKVVDKLSFTKDSLTAPAAGFTAVPCTVTSGTGKHQKDLEFTATVTAADGGTVKISGTVSGKMVEGTIERTPKGGAAKTLQFSGAKAGAK